MSCFSTAHFQLYAHSCMAHKAILAFSSYTSSSILIGKGFCPVPISTVNPSFPNSFINQSLQPPYDAVPVGIHTAYPLFLRQFFFCKSQPNFRLSYRQSHNISHGLDCEMPKAYQPNHAFEVMCNILFKCWLKKEYKDNISHFAFVNGSGGDGGVEAYGLLKSGDIIGVQSKWFPQKMEASQFKQIENSFYTAIKVRPELKRYIVCIPRDFTSKKMVKNNQVARDTEESKWINLCENINKEYPDVVIELWDETSIQEKLCLPETQGCYRYWFECSDVFETEILISYQRAINSWAKTKYIPDLYSTGYIHDKLSSFTGSFEATKKKYDMTQNIYAIVQKLKRAYEDILRLQFPENEKALFEKVKSDISVLGEWLCIIREIGSLVASGSDIERDNFEKKFELNCDSSELKDSSLHFSYYNHFL